MSISTQRIDHIDRVRTAYIMLRDIPLATLSEEYSSINGDSDWVIRPIWENCEKAKSLGLFVDIAGIDLSLHKDEYVRRGVPSFIKQRVIPEGRSDLPVLLKNIGLDENDLFEVLCRSHGICSMDDNYVSRTPDKVVDVNAMYEQYDIPDFDTSSYGWINR